MRFSATLILLLAFSFSPILGGCQSGKSRLLVEDSADGCCTCESEPLGLLQRIRLHRQRFLVVGSSEQDCTCVADELVDGYMISETTPEALEFSESITANSDPSYDAAPPFEPVSTEEDLEQHSVLDNPNRYLVPNLPSKTRKKESLKNELHPQVESQDPRWQDRHDEDQIESDITRADQDRPHFENTAINDSDSAPELDSLDSVSTSDNQDSSGDATPDFDENSPVLSDDVVPRKERFNLPEAVSPPDSFELNEAEREPSNQNVPDASKPIMTRGKTQKSVGKDATNGVATVEEPIILKARPTGNHYTRPIQYSPATTINHKPHTQPSYLYGRPAQRAAVPAQRAGYAPNQMTREVTLDAQGMVQQPIEFRALPAIDLPSLTKVTSARQQFSSLRAESDSEKEKQRLLDIQAIVEHEIERRIQSGEFVSQKDQLQETNQIHPIIIPVPFPVPFSEPSLQLGSPQTKLQRVTPKAAENRFKSQFTAGSEIGAVGGESQVCRPSRKPYVPILSIENFGSPDQFADAYPNLFVPVLEASGPTPNENEANGSGLHKRSEIGIIELNVEATPMRPMSLENAGSGISEFDENAELIRLRAFAQQTGPAAETTARFRNVSTQYRYLSEDENTPRNQQQPNAPEQMMVPAIEIPKIKAAPIYVPEKLERAVLGLSSLKKEAESQAKIRIIER